MSGPGGAVRRGDRGSAHLKRSRPEFEVFRYGRLSATHTRRLHSSRDSGPRSGCGRSCSQVAGGGGGCGRRLQTRAIASAPVHFPFGSGHRHGLPVRRTPIGRLFDDVTQGSKGGEALKGAGSGAG
ncbi:unnamed protein product [Rangifer tarandus platyrhynchus]|uniref:Uncharacterized protein n=2 Tax=Rangifer tarandus platyrhynchus TaxID=3082113 RepID=A0ACB0DQJ4_RANTA|nr:unnamed protein product [Rangifer tarandus platyrhynchus]CAI9690584.1 unnamed protein product [Rangifer tarandus platyrhynchus]